MKKNKEKICKNCKWIDTTNGGNLWYGRCMNDKEVNAHPSVRTENAGCVYTDSFMAKLELVTNKGKELK